MHFKLQIPKNKFYKDYYYNNNSAYRAVAVLALIIIIAIIHGEGMGAMSPMNNINDQILSRFKRGHLFEFLSHSINRPLFVYHYRVVLLFLVG